MEGSLPFCWSFVKPVQNQDVLWKRDEERFTNQQSHNAEWDKTQSRGQHQLQTRSLHSAPCALLPQHGVSLRKYSFKITNCILAIKQRGSRQQRIHMHQCKFSSVQKPNHGRKMILHSTPHLYNTVTSCDPSVYDTCKLVVVLHIHGCTVVTMEFHKSGSRGSIQVGLLLSIQHQPPYIYKMCMKATNYQYSVLQWRS